MAISFVWMAIFPLREGNRGINDIISYTLNTLTGEKQRDNSPYSGDYN
jgi:hypothetical protein